MTVFKNPKDPENTKLITTLEQLIREQIAPISPVRIEVSEIDCADPGCADKTTQLTVVHKDRLSKTFHIHKPIVFIKKSDIEKVFRNYGT